MLLVKKILKEINHLTTLAKNFGFFVSITNFLYLIYPYRKHHNFISKKILYLKHKSIENYIIKKYWNIISDAKTEMSNSTNNTIWILWWQGKEKMPITVRKCYESVIKNSPNCKVILLTKDNFNKYVNISDYILTKFYEGKMTATHFSDILRMNILNQKGGAWLDATIFLSGNISNDYFNKEFFTAKFTNNEIENVSMARWTGFLMFGKSNFILFHYASRLFDEYWKSENHLIDYFLIDYIIDIIYKKTSFKEYIDCLSNNNENIHYLSRHLYDDFNSYDYVSFMKKNLIHKLSWKNTPNYIDDNMNTLWYKIISYYD